MALNIYVNYKKEPSMKLFLTLVWGIVFAAAEAGAVEKNSAVNIVNVNEGLYALMLPDGGNVTVFTGVEGVLLIDTQKAANGNVVLEAVKTVDDRAVDFVVNTHYHYDHVGNNHHLGEDGATIIAHKNTHDHMEEDQYVSFFQTTMPAVPENGLPVLTVAGGMELRYNDELVKFVYLPNAHTGGDIAAYFKERNVIVSGDIVRTGEYPLADLEHGGSIQGLLDALDVLLTLADDKTVIITGHGDLINKVNLANYKHALATIVAGVNEGVVLDRSLKEVIESKPAAKFESDFGSAFMTSDQFVALVYEDLTR